MEKDGNIKFSFFSIEKIFGIKFFCQVAPEKKSILHEKMQFGMIFEKNFRCQKFN